MDSTSSIGTKSDAVQQVLSLAQVNTTIEVIIARWEAPPEAHERFRRWARQVSNLTCGLNEHVAQLKSEFRQLHEQLARTLVQFGHVDEGLVSRRTFIATLIDVIEPHSAVASTKRTFVRTAA
jgi:hypothetical protein